MPGMTVGNSLHTEPEPFEKSMLLQCFQGIVGTTRVEAAMIAEEGTENRLVDTDQKDQDVLHF